MATRALIGLGANLGERELALGRAWDLLGETPGIVLLRISPFHETEPMLHSPEIEQPMYLNAAGLLDAELSARELLRAMLAIEQKLGRTRIKRWDARTMDLDLLLFGDLVLQSEELTVPHPLMTERRFVLEPAAQIAPDMIHPPTGKTVFQLLADLRRLEDKAFHG